MVWEGFSRNGWIPSEIFMIGFGSCPKRSGILRDVVYYSRFSEMELPLHNSEIEGILGVYEVGQRRNARENCIQK